MKRDLYAVIGSLISGSFIAVIMQLNASLGQSVGLLESSFMAHLTGAIVGFVILFRHIKLINLKKSFGIPRYLFLGGAMGVGIVFLSNTVIPKLGMLMTLSLFITSDIIFSAMVDQFGLFSLPKFGINPHRLLGLVMSLFGLALVFWR